jgi:hypothetical protein
MKPAELPSIMIKNLATHTRHWFSEAAIDRAVPCNGPDDGLYIAVMPEDWPADLGEFSDESNIWLLHDADEIY